MDLDKIVEQSFKLLGKHIKELREERNISIDYMSEKTGIRNEYLLKIENGTAIRISMYKHLYKIAKELNIKFAELFNFE